MFHRTASPSLPPTTTEDVRSLVDAAVKDLVLDQIQEQVGSALYNLGPPHLCGSCDAPTNNPADVCRRCQRAGNTADPLHQIGTRLGFTGGVPIDLLEILGLPEAELLLLSQDELAALWDANTTAEIPRLCASENFISGDKIMVRMTPVHSTTRQVRSRPPTPTERAARQAETQRQQAAEETARADERLRRAEGDLQRARDLLDEQRMIWQQTR